MAMSNRDRIGQMFDQVGPALNKFITEHVASGLPDGAPSWTALMQAVDKDKGGGGRPQDYHPEDPQLQLKFLTQDYTNRYRRSWRPFRGTFDRVHEAFAGELLNQRNEWAHGKPFSDDDAYRALDTGERLLRAINAPESADQVAKLRADLRRVTAEKDDRRTLKAAAASPEAAGLPPWRMVLPPHEDVATGNLRSAEFAADLYKVSTGDRDQSPEYLDPRRFFARTFLTEGLRDLISRTVLRLAGDDNASPVINLQTNFGGGKTHSMLALWHLAGNLPVSAYPQELQEVLTAAGYDPARGVRRVAIVGNHFAPTGSPKPDGTEVRTVWGELAWQLGGAEGYGMVADADRAGTAPGEALHDLLTAYAPAVILIDEWVAYARQLYDRNDLAGGTFDTQFTFAQSLTEAVKATSGVLLAISIPASHRDGDGEATPGSAEEVGGANGVEALRRLQNVVRRVADQWRPASSVESYEIVRRRLFVEPDGRALSEIARVARAFVDYYRQHSAEFPRETKDPGYEERIKRTYPIHPELFDRLYRDWSTLERFQQTRGVLRLMDAVIHALWVGEDASPLIMPGSIPIAAGRVNSDLSQYLPDSWKAVIDADVDGPGSEPAKIDASRSVFGQRSLTKRLARTVFFGSAATIGAAHKGIERQRVFLGTAVPGDVPGNFHSALNALADRATYFYAGSGKYWYDLQANITRTARDQAERLHNEDVWAEVVRRLQGQARARGDFAGVHVGPESNADIPDIDEARLVILHPKVVHKRGADSAAKEFAHQATEQRGSANRTHRNMVVYLAADEARWEELDAAVRDYLGWTHVLDNEADLDLTQNQKNQAAQRQGQADQTAAARLLQTFTWALVPVQPDPGAPFLVRETKVEGQAPSLAERVSRRLGNDGDLSTRQAAATIRLAIGKVPQVWEKGHVSLGELWSLYSQYPYMPRLRDRRVLDDGIVDMPMIWQADAFALAVAYDEQAGRYIGLWTPEGGATPPAAGDSLLIVQPDVAAAQLDHDAETAGASDAGVAADGGAGGGAGAGSGASAGAAAAAVDRPEPSGPPPKVRFFGVKTLDPDRTAVDFRNIAEEVIAHLRDPNVQLTVRLEIEATNAVGFDEAAIRTVSENARTLKFEQAGFEEA